MIRTIFGSLLLLSRLSLATESAPEHVGNFGEVNQHLFRGATPSGEAFRELKDLGITLVLDLRGDGDQRQSEKQQWEKLGIRYTNIPLSSFTAPRPSQIEQALSLILSDPSAKVFVHCLRGKDRTGTVIACYRIQHDGWDNKRALDEAKSYGMSKLERSMQSFILRFTPLTLPGLAAR